MGDGQVVVEGGKIEQEGEKNEHHGGEVDEAVDLGLGELGVDGGVGVAVLENGRLGTVRLRKEVERALSKRIGRGKLTIPKTVSKNFSIHSSTLLSRSSATSSNRAYRSQHAKAGVRRRQGRSGLRSLGAV